VSICINESGLLFGDYNDDDVFQIEKSKIHDSLSDCSKTVEFIVRCNTNTVYFIEAKSSSPQPGNEKDFSAFINDISEKIRHSVDLFFALVVKRIEDANHEFPVHFQKADYSDINITALLVINGHQKEWLPPLKDALTQQLKRVIKTWNVKIAVLNHELALDCKLIKGIAP
jgi:hypothetical protein